MGNTVSSDQKKEHVFTAETPVQFGYGLVDNLQKTTESDTTRENAKELDVQKRVEAELKKLEEQETKTLKDLEKRMAEDDISDKLPIDRNTVSDSISKLSKKLSIQSKPGSENEDVKKAEAAVVRCLKLNDRRPLDCWKEVEDFKREIRRKEEAFIGKVAGYI